MTNDMLRLASTLALVAHSSALSIRSTNATLSADGFHYDSVPHRVPSCEAGLEFDGVLFPCPVKSEQSKRVESDHKFHHLSVGLEGSSTFHKIKGFIPSWVACGLGGILYMVGKDGWQRVAATFILFFGAQTFLNFYMKSTLSGFRLTPDYPDLKGMPAPFLIVAIQQLVSFLIMWLLALFKRCTPWSSMMTLSFKFTNKRTVLRIFLLSLAFTINIALNSLSLCLLDISVNLVIRAIGPLATTVVQQCVVYFNNKGWINMTWKELTCLLLGTVCAIVVVLAKTQDSSSTSQNVVLGSIICVLSLLGSAAELIVAAMLQDDGEDQMHAFEVILNTSLPIFAMLVIPIVFIPHPTAWPSSGLTTDIFVTKVVFNLNPSIFALSVLSGLFSMCYNLLLYTLVNKFKAVQAAFASNANKAATIALSMILGFETFPTGRTGVILAFGIGLNLIAFFVYALLCQWRKQSENNAKEQEKLKGEK